MKYLGLLLAIILLVACNNGKQGTKFAPKEREQAFASDAERQAAIDKKRAELDSLNLDIKTLVFDNNIKLTILPPAAAGDITEETSVLMVGKMMQIVAQNGIGGYGNSPAFALAVVMSPTGRATTGTAPQRMISKYTATFVVANMLTGDVYASHSQDIEGVGASFTEASRNAVNEIKNTPALQQMLKTASERIVAWYNHVPGFKAVVEEFVSKQDYETAYALLASVPKQATSYFDYAQKRQGQILEEMKNQKAAETLAELKNAIAAAGEKYDPMPSGYLKMIPANSKQYADASKLYDNYVKRIQDVRLDSIKHEQKMELERLAAEQVKLQHQQKASMMIADRAVSRPLTSSSNVGVTSNSSSGNKIVESFKKHPFLWGLGAGVVATGIGGIALYASLPRLAKFGLALL
jgi:hypothetical protein